MDSTAVLVVAGIVVLVPLVWWITIYNRFVRLKHAIDGQFHIIEITDDHIVLGNTRCPFGDAVRKSPALCRMTSSVFGGIAAHNHDRGAAVILEERIAVGDPGCRVVVYLGDAPDSARSFAHRYTSPDKPVQSS